VAEHYADSGHTNEGGGEAETPLEVAGEQAVTVDPCNVRSTIHRFGSTTKRWQS
jgi:hypothetical protein